jgi:hypothetical protein
VILGTAATRAHGSHEALILETKTVLTVDVDSYHENFDFGPISPFRQAFHS